MSINSFDHYPLTWKPDKSKLTQPYYLSLSKDLETKIKNGTLKEGTKLPPQREIADYLDLNYTTITRVYQLCKKKGLIYGIMGKGTYVASQQLQERSIYANETDNYIEMGAINGFGEYSGLVEKATKKVIEKGYLRELYEYSYPLGHPHQLKAGIRWLEQLQVHTNEDHIAIFAGAQNALTIALISLFSSGDKIAVDEYTYANFIELAKMLQLILIPIANDGHGMIPEELEYQCHLHKIKGIYLIPTCCNPTTITLDQKRRKALVKVIQKQQLILIEDDIASWLFASKDQMFPSMFDLMNRQSIYICGMTKSLCPGLRIAYMAFGEAYKEAMIHGLINAQIKTSSLDAEIMTELILNGDAYKIAHQKQQWTKRNCQIYGQYFQPYHELSYYQWLPIDLDPSIDIEKELYNRGLHIYHSKRFTIKQDAPEYIRISLCSTQTTLKLKQGLQILKDYLQEKSQ